MTDRNAPKTPAALPIRKGDWEITENGLESRVPVGDGRTIDYVIERERLLRRYDLASGLSDFAMQVAGKSWIPTQAANAAFIDALALAIELHHPGQDKIDLDATRLAADREWRRTHRRPFGRERMFDIAEVIHARLDFEREEALAAASAPGAVDPPWLDQYPAEHRALLRQHGVDPAAHPDADACNRRIIADAEAGVTGDELARRAEQHQRAYVGEEEEDDSNADVDEDRLYEMAKDRT